MTLAAIGLSGCHGPVRPQQPAAAPPTSDLVLFSGTPYLTDREDVYGRCHHWNWALADTTGHADQPAPRWGTARLEWLPMDKRQGSTRKLRWTLTPAPDLPAVLILSPEDTNAWHTFRCRIEDAKARPVPLPRSAIESPCYANLLDLVQHLTDDHFQQIVRHWQGIPIPVRCGDHHSGPVDLSACLARAVAIWNGGEHTKWFILDPDADWGIRLLHYAGAHLSPTLRVQLTKHDGRGNPIRMNIAVGDDYTAPGDTTYVIRGMVHELAHTLLLWGHSLDRNHCLWGAAPPIVSAPAPDERKAAHLVRDLPEGLDLKDYFSLNASGSGTASSPPAGRPAGPPR